MITIIIRYEGYLTSVLIAYDNYNHNIIIIVIIMITFIIRYEGYLTSVLLAWMNARCVSFSLDRIWGNAIHLSKSKFQGYVSSCH